MRERIRHVISARAFLDRFVANRLRGVKRALDVAGLKRLVDAVGVLGPYTGIAIGLQLDANLSKHSSAFPMPPLAAAEHGRAVQANSGCDGHFVRDHIRLGELAGRRALHRIRPLL